MNACEGTILVVDDDRDFRGAICAIIRSGGYRVVEETNPAAVLDTIIELNPNLLLLDLYLSGNTGVELVRSMKDQEIDIPVVILSGRVDEKDCRLLRELGVDDILAKPVSKDNLLSKIRKVLPQAGEKNRR